MYVHVNRLEGYVVGRFTFCSVSMQSPFILGSGPLSYDGDGLIRAHDHGFGAVVTKTIRDIPADNPYPHMACNTVSSMVNAEKWSDITGEQWVEQEIPKAKAHGVVVIASIGHTVAEAEHWVPLVTAAGADMIELVSYEQKTMIPMITAACTLTDLPVIAKLSPNWGDPVSCAVEAEQAGAKAITAMDSVGPVLRIDIEKAAPMVGGERGEGWLTGSAIKPIILRYVADISRAVRIPVIGLGGVMSSDDAIEMLMAGASAVGVCTLPLLKGLGIMPRTIRSFGERIAHLGYGSVEEVSGAALPNLSRAENHVRFAFSFEVGKCTSCMRCVTVCPYQSRELSDKVMSLDEDTCRLCGLCASVCPTGALGMVI